MGEHVYFTGTSETFENGDQVEHGKQGEGVKPVTTDKGKGVTVHFSGNKGAIICHLDHVRHGRRHAQPPAAPPAAPINCPSSQPRHPPTLCGAWAHR